MKKVIFSAIVALLLVSAAFGQKTNTEISQIIKWSKEYNYLFNGISDPNKIWPGQTLTFLFGDGTQHQIMVEAGDNQWTILKNKLGKLENEHGSVVNPDTISKTVSPMPIPEPIYFHWWIYENIWIFLIILCVLLAVLIKLLEYTKMFRNPVTAGTPQVPGGVNDAGAHKRLQDVAQNRYPGARLDIRNIRRGRLTGLATVHYAEGKPKKLQLVKTPAYAGEVVVNVNTETIYFLQGCGNDARQGNYMSGNLIFEPEVIINQDGSESPLPVISEKQPAETVPVTEGPTLNPGSETHQRRMKILEIVSEELGNSELHEVLVEEPNDGGFKVQIKYKYEPKSGKKSAEKN